MTFLGTLGSLLGSVLCFIKVKPLQIISLLFLV
jgi:hypothetical protein